MMEMLSSESLIQAGNGIKAFAEYEQIKLDESELTQDKATDIVSKAHGCIGLVGGIELNINDDDKTQFKAAIDSMADITLEDKESLYSLFGIQLPSAP